MKDDLDLPEQILAEIVGLPRGEQDEALEARCRERPDLADILRKGHAAVCLAGLMDLPDPAAWESETGPEVPGMRIVRRLGQGGMGSVYLAVQTEPVRRDVAVKVVRAGFEGARVLARFEQERQALARMSHPHVAQVYGAGRTSGGAPYFSMEYVEGRPIHRYCAEQGLGVEERLRLFLQVCEGVHHAHQKGLIHRDLKPSNILVTGQGSAATAKIIDFGVAKAIEGRLLDETMQTEHGAFIGTPEYMSPEQAGDDPTDIDIRTDVYALGVVLYELMAGRRPFDALRSKSLAEILRIIRDEQPERPSTRATRRGETEGEPGTTAAWVRRLRGDLDWITMKALEKDRERRYVSASELAADIRRHLDHLPVTAGPPSRWYRLQRFVRRNRIGVAAGVAVFLALGIGLGAYYVQLQEARAQTRLAERRSEIARERLGSMVDLTVSIVFQFDSMLVGLPGAREARRFMLERSIEFLEALERQANSDGSTPQDLYRARDTLANGFLSAAQILDEIVRSPKDAEKAIQLAQRSLAEWTRLKADFGSGLLGRIDLGLGEVEGAIAFSMQKQGDWDGALRRYERAEEHARRAIAGGNTRGETTLIAILNRHAELLGMRDEHEQGLAVAREAQELVERREGRAPASAAEQWIVYRARAGTSRHLWDLGRTDEALKVLTRSLESARALVAKHPGDVRAQYELGWCLRDLAMKENVRGNHRASVKLLQEAVPIKQRLAEMDPDSFATATELLIVHLHFAVAAELVGDQKTADAYLEAGLRQKREMEASGAEFPNNQLQISIGLIELAKIYDKRLDSRRSLMLLQEAVPLLQRLVDARPDQIDFAVRLLVVRLKLAGAAEILRDRKTSDTYLEAALRQTRQMEASGAVVPPPKAAEIAKCFGACGRLRAVFRKAGGVEIAKEGVAFLEARMEQATHAIRRSMVAVYIDLAEAHESVREWEALATVARKGLALCSKILEEVPGDSWTVCLRGACLRQLAEAQDAAGQQRETLATLEEAYRILRGVAEREPEEWVPLEVLDRVIPQLMRAHESLGDSDAAREMREARLWLLVRQGQRKTASAAHVLTSAEIVVEQDPSDPAAWRNLASCMKSALGRLDGSRRVNIGRGRVYNLGCRLQEVLSIALEKLGESAEAVVAARAALELLKKEPGTDARRQALEERIRRLDR